MLSDTEPLQVRVQVVHAGGRWPFGHVVVEAVLGGQDKPEVAAQAVTGADGLAVLELAPDLWNRQLAVRVSGQTGAEVELSQQQLGGEETAVLTVTGGDGLASVDFAKLLGQMAKSISVSSMQGAEAPYTRALFRQDQWVHVSSASASGLR